MPRSLLLQVSDQPAVYILASANNKVLYVGVTSQLLTRIWHHKNNSVVGFTNTYRVHHLVYYELHSTMYDAITREKQLKKWRRVWKEQLISKNNPHWYDLYESLL